MRFFLLLVVALTVTVIWQTTIGAAPDQVGSLGGSDAALPPGITACGFATACHTRGLPA
jgi:hypothetical protein